MVVVGKVVTVAAGSTAPSTCCPVKERLTTLVYVDSNRFARFPLANVEPMGDGFEVRVRDMRFESELPGRRGVIAVIELNAQSQVIGEHFEFDASQ